MASGNTDTPEQIASDQAAIDTRRGRPHRGAAVAEGGHADQPHQRHGRLGRHQRRRHGQRRLEHRDHHDHRDQVLRGPGHARQRTGPLGQGRPVGLGRGGRGRRHHRRHGLPGRAGAVERRGYTYPSSWPCPRRRNGLFTGSTANVDISTGSVSNVVAVPTSAVQTLGTRSYVLELDKGVLTRKVIKIGMVGDDYTQVALRAVSPGQSVVLADYAEPVPVVQHQHATPRRVLGGGGGGGGSASVLRRRRRHLRSVDSRGTPAAARKSGRRLTRRANAATSSRLSTTVAACPDPPRSDQPLVGDVEASRTFYARLGLDFGEGATPSGPTITSRPSTASDVRSTSTSTARPSRSSGTRAGRAAPASSSGSRSTGATRSTPSSRRWPPMACLSSRSPSTRSGVPATPS